MAFTAFSNALFENNHSSLPHLIRFVYSFFTLLFLLLLLLLPLLLLFFIGALDAEFWISCCLTFEILIKYNSNVSRFISMKYAIRLCSISLSPPSVTFYVLSQSESLQLLVNQLNYWNNLLNWCHFNRALGLCFQLCGKKIRFFFGNSSTPQRYNVRLIGNHHWRIYIYSGWQMAMKTKAKNNKNDCR